MQSVAVALHCRKGKQGTLQTTKQQCTVKVILRRVRVTIVTVEKQLSIHYTFRASL